MRHQIGLPVQYQLFGTVQNDLHFTPYKCKLVTYGKLSTMLKLLHKTICPHMFSDIHVIILYYYVGPN